MTRFVFTKRTTATALSVLLAVMSFAALPNPTLAAVSGPAQPLAPAASKAFLARYSGADVSPEKTDRFQRLFDKTSLIAAINSLADHGLTPSDYHLAALERLGPQDEAFIAYGLDAWMSAASHMAFGKISPTSVEPDWTAKGRQADLMAHLEDALETGRLASSLDRLAPQHKAYQSLHEALKSRRKAARQSVAEISAGETLKIGMSSPRVSALQMRLGQTPTGHFDADLQQAVIDFQSGAGLDDDGVAGPATIRALNRGPAAEIAQLRVNLERWRWLPDDLGRRHVRVNIADFSVQAWSNGEIVAVHGAIVGKTYRKTPVFSDKISYAVLNPWWETPVSLTRRDKIPQFKRDPSAVSRLGFQVLDSKGQVVDASTIDWNSIPAGTSPYRLRQAPGPLNALGQVKIMFPNAHNVYLHDTPDRGLFAQRQRAFSSGCIRTQNPIDLTEWLLAETPGWTRVKIDEALASKRETRASLAAPVPVHILYMTTVSDEAGVRFVDDIYDRDAAILAGINRTISKS